MKKSGSHTTEPQRKDNHMDQFEMTTEKLPTLKDATAEELANAIAEVLDSKKGHDIKVLKVSDKTVIADYFVICSGNTSTQVKALADEVEYRMDLRDVKPYGVEGRDNGAWAIVDYSNVIVHVFSRDAREFYKLDKLYAD